MRKAPLGLLSAVRISAAHFHSSNAGHSSALGMAWMHRAKVTYSVSPRARTQTAHPYPSSSTVGATFVLTGVVSLLAVITRVSRWLRTPRCVTASRSRGNHRRREWHAGGRARLLGLIDQKGATANRCVHGRHRPDPRSAGEAGPRFPPRRGWHCESSARRERSPATRS